MASSTCIALLCNGLNWPEMFKFKAKKRGNDFYPDINIFGIRGLLGMSGVLIVSATKNRHHACDVGDQIRSNAVTVSSE